MPLSVHDPEPVLRYIFSFYIVALRKKIVFGIILRVLETIILYKLYVMFLCSLLSFGFGCEVLLSNHCQQLS
jgi:hypothetical protein